MAPTVFDVEGAYALEHLDFIPRKASPSQIKQWSHLADIELLYSDWNDIGVLIGMDVNVHDIFETERDQKHKNGPRANLTHFGWCVVDTSHHKSPQCHFLSSPVAAADLQTLQQCLGVKQFFD